MALGRELIIKRKNDATEEFDIVCVVEQRSLNINNEEVDTTKPDFENPGGVLKYSSIGGVQSVRWSGSGAYVSSATQALVLQDILGQTKSEYQVTVPSVGTFEGPMTMLSANFQGDKSGELTCDLAGVFDGSVVFAAAN
ncbi:phage tail tube protein [Martelella mediterranea]|uniref:Putative secreted protein n=1 Tax=Martelella mediterranea TaxID=293089 RepID=A0A4R3NL04_9HYPH|nr:phage tail tube protein [Martelella mediterranea]TCT34709.1 putative secreted protein [Martelella mediterranea]